MRCEDCPENVCKLIEVEAMSLTSGAYRFWLCETCLEYARIPKGNGTWVVTTGRTREKHPIAR